MRKMRTALALALALALVALPLVGETGFTDVSATTTNATTTFTTAQTYVLICNYGGDDIHFRLFDSEDTPADATTSHTLLVAGSATDPKCISFPHNPRSQKGLGWGAVSIICPSTTATVHLITE